MGKALHIISLNVPYPANYGGVIDIFYRIKTLSELGVDIILHCFQYGRESSAELNKYCKKVYYYPRKTGLTSQCSLLPYIVNSRRSDALLDNLCADSHPILFEGIHSCYYLNHNSLQDRYKLVRMHNIEQNYYRGLAKNTHAIWLKAYYTWEAWRLQRFEPQLHQAQGILAISKEEEKYFKTLHSNVVWLPAQHANKELCISEQSEPYVLYHGDLSSAENTYNALFLMENVASQTKEIQWVFAGLHPPKKLYATAKKYINVHLLPNLSEEKMKQKVAEAHITVLYTKQAVGLKLKLINAMYNSHYCIATPEMLLGSELQEACILSTGRAEDLVNKVREYIHKDFPLEEKQRRKALLGKSLDNVANCRKILDLLP